MKKLQIFLLGLLVGIIPTAFASGPVSFFSDVNDGDWYETAVENLAMLGIVEGYEDKTYRPSSNVNRAEMAIMLDRLMESLRTGCFYEDKIYFNGDIIEEDTYQVIWCEDGSVQGETWD